MRIRFETTIEDVIAFHRFHYAHSPTWRRLKWAQTVSVPAILAILLFLYYIVADPGEDFSWAVWITVAIFCSIFWGFFIRLYMNSGLESNTRKFLAEGSNRIMFGWREMEFVNNRLILNTELIQSSLDLRAIEKIVSDANYTYVYFASTSAYMIPMNLYPEDEYREFVAELREAWDDREAPRPVEEADRRAACPTDARITEKPS